MTRLRVETGKKLTKSSSPNRLVFSNDGEKRPSSQISFLKMLGLSLILVFPLTICGMSTSFPAVALPQMELEMGHASSFGSMLQFASPFGALFVGIIIDKYGRRAALLFSILPSIIGWFILYLDKNITLTIFGQLLNGLMSGAVGYPSQVYAGECIMVNNPLLRNSFLSWIAISNAFGMFLVYVLGYYLSYKWIAAAASIMSSISFALTYFCIPESPSWLHLQGRTGDAEWSQKRLGICNPLLENAHPHYSCVPCDNLDLSPMHMSVQKLKRNDVWKPLLLGTILTGLLSFTGGMPLLTYMVQIIGLAPGNVITAGHHLASSNVTSASDYFVKPILNVGDSAPSTSNTSTSTPVIDLAANITQVITTERVDSVTNSSTTNNFDRSSAHTYGLSIISGALILVANIVMSLMLPYFGIKKILILPLLGMAVGLIAEAVTTSQKSDSAMFVIHIGAVWFITFMYSYSLLNVPDSMLGDLFPVDAKGFASLPYLCEGFLTALICKLHPHLYFAIGGYLFIFYSVICLSSASFVLFFIPEIVGKTLQEINESFM